MYTINVMPTATSLLPAASRCVSLTTKPRIAPPAVSRMGSKSALGSLGTPAFGHVVTNARTVDAKQAAPPRGRFR
jgi:hypothetical protein